MKDEPTVWELIKSDYYCYYGRERVSLWKIFLALIGKNKSFAFCFWLRLSSRRNIFRPFAILLYKIMGRQFCLDISYRMKLGKGFHMQHAQSIVIGSKTVIGDNFTIFHNTSIGTDTLPAVIGDNVCMYPNSCIVNQVNVGNNVKIGAGAVVIRDIPGDCTAVGNPARNIPHKK